MSKVLNRIVIYATLHEGIFIPKIGDLGKVFPAQDKTLEKLHMIVDEEGLVVNAVRPGFPAFEVLIPWANVKQAVLAPQDEKNNNSKK